ncbi:hypothetical protein KY341_01205 [Candidatus Woesearchaeota archaeon]|nr:hypothetical protein [Candidatus Woesearchaeota archaeon]
MDGCQRKNEQQKKLFPVRQEARSVVYTIGPDGFVYPGRIKAQEFDKRYCVR